MPDKVDDPITYDFAAIEVENNSNKERVQKTVVWKGVMNKHYMKQAQDLKKQLESERMTSEKKLRVLEEELNKLN